MIAVVAHVVANAASPYGFHRDEFLYFAMGEHLHLWRMDFPPFIAIVARSSRALFGDSLVATRLFPALGHGLLIWMATRMARILGGGRYAQWMAGLAVLVSPLFMRTGNLFQPVIFDQVWWTAALFCALKLGLDENPRWWLGIGVTLGFGLLTKFSIAFIALPLAAGIAVSPLRKWLATPWPWAAAALALAIGHPSLTGQFLLGYPVSGQMRDLQTSQLSHVTPADFLVSQVLYSPVFVPLSLWGLVDLFRRPSTRAVAVACAGAELLLVALRGKPYYVGPVYPALFAATAVCLERAGSGRVAQIARGAVAGVVVALGLCMAPFGFPVVPPASMARYAATLGITRAVRTNQGELLELPQDYADMLGWEALVREVARVYHTLPADERERAVIFGANYGRAGAIDFFASRFDVPHSVSARGSYWFFGPGKRSGDVLVHVGGDREDLDPYYESVEPAGHTSNPLGVHEERSVTIWVCRKPRNGMTLQSLWPSLVGQN